MASNLSTRAVRTACSASKAAPRPLATAIPRRTFATGPESSTGETEQPRWSYTPPRAKAPFSLRLHSKRPFFHVNSDPALLDQFYIRMLGNDGDKMLSDELKWLAVTHKSFDQGRRGFNDRLAFLGKRIVQLQTSLALVQSSEAATTSANPDPYGRTPFSHPALDGLRSLSPETKSFLTDRSKLSELAQKYEMQNILRWTPRKPDDLKASGLELVLAHTMYAVVGAVSLEKGGHIANKVAQERILEPLGLKTVS
ncbi:Uncharacterized protein PECH_005850 [Penicillium ucsense]|uniref:RNase III domain-containing protein n=1 Tax=Penicillium ucsense TaxID=2839758 RepID=A0A8J8W9B9_9EURO|nr:Uncharacterized protein PECM_000735 [Penicillium ucsense]KAF7736042.1 Uncharacterized protein PECH_005850 [Penicillium ucsense]